MNKIDKRKVFGTVIGGILFLTCILFFTYAYYNWRSENTTFSFAIEDASVICENGPNVNVSNIGPVLDYNDGVAATFNIQNSTDEVINMELSLNITSISSSLQVESFKYILLKDNLTGNGFVETGIEGNFSTFQVGSNIISETVSVDASSSNSFKFIVYIDGTMYNDSNMMSSSMNSNLVIGNCGGIGTVDTSVYLNSVAPGSYVAYTGTNGCPEGHCDGTNANYVSDSNMGYCEVLYNKYSVNGWRVGYIQNGTAYLVSAGATECMCTKADGTTSDSSCSDYETTAEVPQHLANLDSKALTYCNPEYAYGGVCNSESAWAMDATDFQAITGSTLSSSSCYQSSNDTSCGYENDLIDNGGYYWYATPYGSSSTYTFFWYPGARYVGNRHSDYVEGVRPVLRLASSVQVVGGSGTYEDPYQIENPTRTYLSDVEPGSYVTYTGTNGCPDGHCDGTNANYVSDSDMGYCTSSSYKFSVNGWRVGYIQNDTAYLVSAGATECMCTSADGTTSDSSCSGYETTAGVPQHLANLDSKALTYCNPNYAYGGVCNSNSAWAMDATDFQAITGSALSFSSCNASSNDTSCGYENDLIDNGGYYWYAIPYTSSSTKTFYWYPSYRVVSNYSSNGVYGVRPILRLKSNILVVGGSGTYEDPYQISAG